MPLNYAKTLMLLVVLTGIFVAMGAVVGGRTGLVIAFIMALVMNVMSLWKSDTMVLRMFRAQEVDEKTAPELHQIVRGLAQRAELPMPRVYIMNTPQPNAFATGRNPANSAVAFSTGLLEALSPEEVAGVAAHELSHIKNRDTLTMAVAATIGGAISMMAQYLQFGMLFGGGNRDGRGGFGFVGALFAMIAAPFAAMLVQMAISRSREYQADRMGAALCGNPRWLATGLGKIDALARKIPNQQAEMHPAGAHLFIVNPLTGRGVDNWFATHPAMENRLAELAKLEQEWIADGTLPASQSDIAINQGGGAASGPWTAGRGPDQKQGPWG
jgi:heat shock protein HtpX